MLHACIASDMLCMTNECFGLGRMVRLVTRCITRHMRLDKWQTFLRSLVAAGAFFTRCLRSHPCTTATSQNHKVTFTSHAIDSPRESFGGLVLRCCAHRTLGVLVIYSASWELPFTSAACPNLAWRIVLRGCAHGKLGESLLSRVALTFGSIA